MQEDSLCENTQRPESLWKQWYLQAETTTFFTAIIPVKSSVKWYLYFIYVMFFTVENRILGGAVSHNTQTLDEVEITKKKNFFFFP